MKTPIVYYGGKTSMLPFILPLFPEHEVYTEVFFGGGAAFWAKKKVKNETINDTLDIVVNFYQVLKLKYKQLKPLIDATCFSRTLHDKALLIIRNKQLFSDVDMAWAFWMASNFSYACKIGGGIKYSNDQSMLPPRVMQNFKREFTEMLVKRIEDTHIECRDGMQILKSRNVPKAFHFIDPPYPNADQGHYAGYGLDDFELLLQCCEHLKGKFMLHNYNSEMLDQYIIKNNWWSKEFTFRNKGMRKNDAAKTEIVVCNYEPVTSLEFEF